MEKIKIFFKKYKNEIFLSILIFYIFLLGFGVIGELFHIQWILDLPLYKI